MERRIGRYKNLLGERVINQDDEIGDLELQLEERECKIRSQTSELNELNTSLEGVTKKLAQLEQRLYHLSIWIHDNETISY